MNEAICMGANTMAWEAIHHVFIVSVCIHAVFNNIIAAFISKAPNKNATGKQYKLTKTTSTSKTELTKTKRNKTTQQTNMPMQQQTK
jgi:hypothetical protein